MKPIETITKKSDKKYIKYLYCFIKIMKINMNKINIDKDTLEDAKIILIRKNIDTSDIKNFLFLNFKTKNNDTNNGKILAK